MPSPIGDARGPCAAIFLWHHRGINNNSNNVAAHANRGGKMFSRFRAALAACAFALMQLVLAGGAQAQFNNLCPAVSNLPYALTVLKFPQAWNKTCGTGYVAILDRGIPPAGVNVRTHLSRDCHYGTKYSGANESQCVPPGVNFLGY